MDSRERSRAVFDCMIFLQGAARRESPSGACLDLARRRMVDLCLSPEILSEVEQILKRPAVRAKFSTLTDQLVNDFIQSLLGFSTLFGSVAREYRLERDPKDEPYLNLACQLHAAHLVTRDKDLLDLSFSDSEPGTTIRRNHPHLNIVEPIPFLDTIRRGLRPRA